MNAKADKWRHKGIGIDQIDFGLVQSEFAELISGSPPEETVQKYIEAHCYLLLQARNSPPHSAVVTKPRLTDEFVADFIMFGGCNWSWVTLVEIEKPTDLIFTQAGDYSGAFSHALRQVSDWKEWICDNTPIFHRYFGHSSARFEIILGRRHNLKDARHRLKAIDSSITVSTFDSLLPTSHYSFSDFNSFVQREAITFPEYKEICNIGTGKDSRADPWFLIQLWDH